MSRSRICDEEAIDPSQSHHNLSPTVLPSTVTALAALGDTVVAGTQAGASIFSLARPAAPVFVTECPAPALAVAIHSHSGSVGILTADGDVRLVDPSSGVLAATFASGHARGTPGALAFALTAPALACAALSSPILRVVTFGEAGETSAALRCGAAVCDVASGPVGVGVDFSVAAGDVVRLVDLRDGSAGA